VSTYYFLRRFSRPELEQQRKKQTAISTHNFDMTVVDMSVRTCLPTRTDSSALVKDSSPGKRRIQQARFTYFAKSSSDQGPSGGYSVARKSLGERVVYEIPGCCCCVRPVPGTERCTHLSRPQGSRLKPELVAPRVPVDAQPTRLVTSMTAQRRSTVRFISNQSFRCVCDSKSGGQFAGFESPLSVFASQVTSESIVDHRTKTNIISMKYVLRKKREKRLSASLSAQNGPPRRCRVEPTSA
jgi:hypothetical protein